MSHTITIKKWPTGNIIFIIEGPGGTRISLICDTLEQAKIEAARLLNNLEASLFSYPGDKP